MCLLGQGDPQFPMGLKGVGFVFWAGKYGRSLQQATRSSRECTCLRFAGA